jgi:hypothetical protein
MFDHCSITHHGLHMTNINEIFEHLRHIRTPFDSVHAELTHFLSRPSPLSQAGSQRTPGPGSPQPVPKLTDN